MGVDVLKLIGDPKRLAEESVKVEYEEAKRVLDEALDAAIRLIEDAYRKALRDAEERVIDGFSRIQERLSSRKSALDLKLRNKVATEKSRYIDEALSKATDAIRREKDKEWYQSFLRNALLRAASDIPGGRLIVYAAEDDLERVKAVIEGLGGDAQRLVVASKPVEIIGGVIVESEDGSERLDYSLDLIIRSNETRIRALASRMLFSKA